MAGKILLINHGNALMANTLKNLLKDACFSEDKPLCIMGHEKEINEIKGIIPGNMITHEFPRPVDVKNIAAALHSLIRGFGTGAMHVACGMAVAAGLFYLWDVAWLRAVGTFALLCFVITYHAVFNILVKS